MTEAPASLVRDFLQWLAAGPRPYADVMDTWRTSCPRLTVWEDAIDDGLVAHVSTIEGIRAVGLTARGRAMLDEPAPPGPASREAQAVRVM